VLALIGTETFAYKENGKITATVAKADFCTETHEYTYDKAGHQSAACDVCGTTAGAQKAHVFGSDGKCACGYSVTATYIASAANGVVPNYNSTAEGIKVDADGTTYYRVHGNNGAAWLRPCLNINDAVGEAEYIVFKIRTNKTDANTFNFYFAYDGNNGVNGDRDYATIDSAILMAAEGDWVVYVLDASLMAKYYAAPTTKVVVSMNWLVQGGDTVDDSIYLDISYVAFCATKADVVALVEAENIAYKAQDQATAATTLNDWAPELAPAPEVPTVPAGEIVTEAETEIVEEQAYKMQLATKGLYVTGEMSSHYGATSNNFANGVDFYAEVVEGGFKLYFMKADVKTYVNVVLSGDYINVKFLADSASVFTYDTELGAFVTKIDDAIYWIGTRSTFTTLGAYSHATYAVNANDSYPITLIAYNCGHAHDAVCDTNCNLCGVVRTAEDHEYDNACDANCNNCQAARTPSACVDENSDGACDSCGKAMTAAYVLVTDASQIKVGSKIIIVANGENFALSTDQRNNNRGQTDVVKAGDGTISGLSDAVQVLTVEAGTKDGTFAFNTGSGYLYAASSGSNHLKTQSDKNDNASWKLSFTAEGVASVVAQGTNTRNTMQYNKQSSIFACYGSASQQAISIYVISE
jgi:hypothetical protein